MFYAIRVTYDGESYIERHSAFRSESLNHNFELSKDRAEAETALSNARLLWAHNWRIAAELVELSEEEGGPLYREERLARARFLASYPDDDFEKPDFAHADWYAPHKETHLALLAYKDKRTVVSFYERESHMLTGRRTEMRLGRYLRRFNPALKDEEVERYVAETDVRMAGPAVQFTQDADTIQEVYENGPSSCMSHCESSYESHVHPVRVYAGPDLALAYLGDPEDASARCVVWPDKMIYNEPYGDVSRMVRSLEALGYSSGSLNGARVRLIEDDYGSVAMPYVDGVSGATIEDGFVVLGKGYAIDTSNTNGLGTESRRSRCEDCSETYDSDSEGGYVETPCYGGMSLCQHCYDHRSVWCEDSSQQVHESYATRVILADGEEGYAADWRVDLDYRTVEGRDLAVHKDLCVEVDGQWYHQDDAPEASEEDDTPPTAGELEDAGQGVLPLARVEDVSEARYCVFGRGGTLGPAWSPCTPCSCQEVGTATDYAAASEWRDYLTAQNRLTYIVVHTDHVEGEGRAARIKADRAADRGPTNFLALAA